MERRGLPHNEMHEMAVANSIAMSPNKQLQRTVMRHRGDAASAPFHYALASRFTRQRRR